MERTSSKVTVFTFPCPKTGDTLSFCKELDRRGREHCTDPTSVGMRVEYERIDTGDDLPDWRYEYREKKDPVACCAKMREWFGEIIRFGGEFGHTPRVGFHYKEWDCDRSEPIDFCPWCGKPIKPVEVARLKRVETKKEVTKTVVETETTFVPED